MVILGQGVPYNQLMEEKKPKLSLWKGQLGTWMQAKNGWQLYYRHILEALKDSGQGINLLNGWSCEQCI